jgi:hypothetical protein
MNARTRPPGQQDVDGEIADAAAIFEPGVHKASRPAMMGVQSAIVIRQINSNRRKKNGKSRPALRRNLIASSSMKGPPRQRRNPSIEGARRPDNGDGPGQRKKSSRVAAP